MKYMNLLYSIYLFLALIFSVGCSDSDDMPTPPDPEEKPVPAEPTVFDTIMVNIQAEQSNVNLTSTEKEVTSILSLWTSNGSFSDINYTRKDQTNWEPIKHLDRLKSMSLAYILPGGRYSGDKSLHEKIAGSLQYWYDKHPTSTNWFMQQIACPQRLGVILILLRKGKDQLPQTLENKLLDRMKQEGGRPDQPGSQGTGANKTDIAVHWIYRGCLTADAAVLSFGVEQVYYPLFLTTGEGLQHDFSYLQHGPQLYTAGYGSSIINGIGNVAVCLTGTPYALSGEKAELLSKFVRTSYIPVIRGQYFLYNVLGRGLSRKNAIYQGGSSKPLELMKRIDASHTAFYEAAIQRLKATEPAGYGIEPSNTHFWRSDYTLHQRPGYTFDTRTASVYTARNENGNGENLLGYFLTDGANTITVRGDEYADIFPVWDWAMIPGVTSPHLTTIPLPAEWQIPGTSRFTGGTSDGRYGVSTYVLDDTDYGILTQARKAWFYFDNEVVCLGADIQSGSSHAVNTTVNQCLLQGAVSVHSQGSTQTVANGMHAYSNPSWILHNGVGYYFPQGGKVLMSNQEQTGNWKIINNAQADAQVSKDVFKLWFDHGISPKQQTYAYIVVPGIQTTSEAAAYPVDNIRILANTNSLQVVRNEQLNIYGLVFYKAATFQAGNLKVHADKGCVLLLKDVGTSQVRAYVADPSRKESAIKLTFSLPSIDGQKVLQCNFPVSPDPYAGATKEFILTNQ